MADGGGLFSTVAKVGTGTIAAVTTLAVTHDFQAAADVAEATAEVTEHTVEAVHNIMEYASEDASELVQKVAENFTCTICLGPTKNFVNKVCSECKRSGRSESTGWKFLAEVTGAFVGS